MNRNAEKQFSSAHYLGLKYFFEFALMTSNCIFSHAPQMTLTFCLHTKTGAKTTKKEKGKAAARTLDDVCVGSQLLHYRGDHFPLISRVPFSVSPLASECGHSSTLGLNIDFRRTGHGSSGFGEWSIQSIGESTYLSLIALL